MKNRTWISLFLAFAAVLLLIWLLLPGPTGSRVEITLDGETVAVITPGTEPWEQGIQGPVGTTVIRVTKDAVSILSAPCPDQFCQHRGEMRPGELPVICLPNRLSIRWTADNPEYDAVSGRGG